MLAMQKLQIGVHYQIKEALILALDLLKDANPQMAAQGIEGVARLGGKPYAALLIPFLKEKRELFRQPMMVNNKQVLRVVEVRDVALGWLIDLTGQDHAQYDMPDAKQWFQNFHRFQGQPFMFGSTWSIGFRAQEPRGGIEEMGGLGQGQPAPRSAKEIDHGSDAADSQACAAGPRRTGDLGACRCVGNWQTPGGPERGGTG